MNKLFTLIIILTLVTFGVSSCGQNETDEAGNNAEETGLTDFEMDHGIGPIDQRIEIPDEIDMEKVEKGRQVYRSRCSSCHRMEGRHVGPELGKITTGRSPEFIMNFILNPSENIQRHPVGQALLREYLVEMPYQNVDKEQARAIVEYLRYQAEEN